MSSSLSTLLRIPRSIIEWAPIWAPLAISTQIAILGLRPALQEQRRLEHEEKILEQRYAELSQERSELDLRLEAQSDPLFLERERRALLDPNSPIR